MVKECEKISLSDLIQLQVVHGDEVKIINSEKMIIYLDSRITIKLNVPYFVYISQLAGPLFLTGTLCYNNQY